MNYTYEFHIGHVYFWTTFVAYIIHNTIQYCNFSYVQRNGQVFNSVRFWSCIIYGCIEVIN